MPLKDGGEHAHVVGGGFLDEPPRRPRTARRAADCGPDDDGKLNAALVDFLICWAILRVSSILMPLLPGDRSLRRRA